MKMRQPAYSYRNDPSVPRFDDAQPIVVFDGECVLCSRFMRFIIRKDHRRRFRFVVAQSPLGRALNQHYGLDPDRRETYLVMSAGEACAKAAAFSAIMSRLGWPWRLLAFVRWLPEMLTDRGYDWIRDHKYRLMGRAAACDLPSEDFRERLLFP